ncbi:hypothetical protein CAEBREN_11932 [Caenorhabditis brenneri]|uniref:T20D4.11-like domain-containing protein n=1 Tax=Caenorhabditis brenneri TaxID=135651 RepID=G0M9X4_CAEBE|nr:hypothetical protein CAEBREN_11932 [Caenorhabditis brenneri]
MTDLCQKVSNCYGSIQCQESIDKMNKNNGFCEEDQYIFGDVPECIKWFFKEVYTMDYYACLKEHEFLSHNLTTKRSALTSGESCVLQVFNASQFFECERDSVEFITRNYNKVIDYLTINPGTKPSCHGVYPVYQKLQCEVIKDVLDEKRKELDENRDNNKTEINEFKELGKTVKDCMTHSCLYTSKDFREVDFQIGMTKLTNSPVLDCFQKIKEMKLDLSEKYPCTKDKELARKKECKLPIFRDFFINILSIFALPVQDVTIQPCSTEILLKIQQECGPAQKKLEVLIEKYDGQVPPEEVIEEMDVMFQNLTTCYAAFNCTQSIKYRQYLTKKFSEIRIHNLDINGCMLEFYGALYEGTYNCTLGYEWFSTDLLTKRNAYISGKSCFLEIASNECSNATINYLKTDYEPLVDIMTTRPNGPECQGLFYELNDLKCNQPMGMLGVQISKLLSKVLPKEINEQAAEKNDEVYQFFQKDTINKPMLCMAWKMSSRLNPAEKNQMRFQDCLQNGCAFRGLHEGQDIDDGACYHLEKTHNINAYFFDCLLKMETFNTTKYPCLPPDLKDMTRDPNSEVSLKLEKECTKSTCYATFNCTQANEYRKYLTRKFYEIRIHNFDINGCMLEFYGALYEGTYNCTKDYEWFSTDLLTKRKAYISGKSCFLEIASNECSNATNSYLKTDYEQLVDIITTKPNGPECQGLFYELNDLKCNQPMNMLGLQAMKLLTKIMPKKENEKIADGNDKMYQFFQEDTTDKPMLCMALKDCVQNGCALKWLQGGQEILGEACDQVGKADNLNEHFFDCLWKMEMYNTTKYPCLPPDLKNMTRQPDTGPLESLGKECARSVMQEECPGVAMNDFDGNWDWAKDAEKQDIEDKKKRREMNED